jgi:hypothetical protein
MVAESDVMPLAATLLTAGIIGARAASIVTVLPGIIVPERE